MWSSFFQFDRSPLIGICLNLQFANQFLWTCKTNFKTQVFVKYSLSFLLSVLADMSSEGVGWEKVDKWGRERGSVCVVLCCIFVVVCVCACVCMHACVCVCVCVCVCFVKLASLNVHVESINKSGSGSVHCRDHFWPFLQWSWESAMQI